MFQILCQNNKKILEQQSIKKQYPMILKLQFENFIEIGHDFELL